MVDTLEKRLQELKSKMHKCFWCTVLPWLYVTFQTHGVAAPREAALYVSRIAMQT